MIALDLFAGTGAATLPFREAGWTVVEIDLLPRPRTEELHPHRIVADVGRLPLSRDRLLGRVDFLWSSPPCTEYSGADARVDHRRKRPSLDHVVATLEAVRDLRPRFWILENVRGAIPFLGIPAQKIGPFCLWGYFPEIRVPFSAWTHTKGEAGRSPAERARIPYALAEAVYQAVGRGMRLPTSALLDLRPFRRHRHIALKRAAGPDLFPPSRE